MKGKMNGLDLFSGYGGITIALNKYCTPIMYCEIERYAQAILLSRMDDEAIPFAPIWNDVRTLDGSKFRGMVEIVYGGFPCQDISSAGLGKGLDGERSGLFYEVIRICKEASPLFIFLENVAGIRTKGSIEVQEALASIGYDTRFGHISASEVGACHERDRWFCLATKRKTSSDSISERAQIPTTRELPTIELLGSDGEDWATIANAKSSDDGLDLSRKSGRQIQQPGIGIVERTGRTIWPTESPICGADDVPTRRVDRIKALGNGVVPLQVKTAFEILMGIKE